jgi:hypothetical protein
MQTKGDLAQYVGDLLALNGALSSATPDTTERILKVLELVVAEIEGNGVRISWNASPDPMNPAANEEIGTPIGMFQPLAKAVAIHVAPMIGAMVTPQLQMVTRSAYQSLMKFDWKSTTPQPRLRANSPLGSGNTKYRYVPDFMPDVQNIDVENSTSLDNLTE